MIKLGTHNSWTYAKPTKWYVPHFIAKCQNVDIEEQYKLGSRWFDLRLKYVNGKWIIAHGLIEFNVDWRESLKWLNNQNDEIYVRVLLEYNKKPKDDIILYFNELCNILVNNYRNIKFTGGQCKADWITYHKFEYYNPPALDRYSSTTSLFKLDSKLLSIIDDWCPLIYAKLYNNKNYEFYKDNDEIYLLVDFIDLIKK